MRSGEDWMTDQQEVIAFLSDGAAYGLPGDQFTVEAFYRFTASQNFAVTGSLQFIANPLLDPSQDHILFAGLRARLQM